MTAASYPQRFRVSVPVAYSAVEAVTHLKSVPASKLIEHALIEVAQNRSENTAEVLAALIKHQLEASERAAKACYVDIQIASEVGVTSLRDLQKTVQTKLHRPLNGEANAVCVAYWLHDQTKSSVLSYLYEGALSELACNDILTMATQRMTGQKKGWQGVANEADKKAGNPMSNHKEGVLVPFKVAGTLQMSEAEKAFHQKKMEEFRDSVDRGDKFTMSAEDAISMIKQQIKAASPKR